MPYDEHRPGARRHRDAIRGEGRAISGKVRAERGEGRANMACRWRAWMGRVTMRHDPWMSHVTHRRLISHEVATDSSPSRSSLIASRYLKTQHAHNMRTTCAQHRAKKDMGQHDVGG